MLDNLWASFYFVQGISCFRPKLSCYYVAPDTAMGYNDIIFFFTVWFIIQANSVTQNCTKLYPSKRISNCVAFKIAQNHMHQKYIILLFLCCSISKLWIKYVCAIRNCVYLTIIELYHKYPICINTLTWYLLVQCSQHFVERLFINKN